MDLSIPVRVEMKYAGGSLAVATWDDRRPICVRRPEATGALLMRGPDSSLSLSLSAAEAARDTYKCPQSRH